MAFLTSAIVVARRDDGWRATTTFVGITAVVALGCYAIWIALHGWPPVGFCELLGC